jgi:hypothetical protein
VSNRWAIEDQGRDRLQQMTSRHSWGLWARCDNNVDGSFICDHYEDLILGSARELVGARAGMLIGAALSLICLCMAPISVDCATALSGNGRKKLRLTIGSMLLISGLMQLLVAIMIFVVIGKHYHEQNVYYYQVQPGRYGRDIEMMPPNMKAVRVGGVGGSLKDTMDQDGKTMTFGPGSYLAAGSGLFTLISGIIMLAQGCGRTEDEDDDYTMGIVRSNNDSVTGLKKPRFV